MTTKVWQVDPRNPEPAIIAKAAAIVRSGGLVAFPTETVYGLGANGLDAGAVERIYAAKGRPARNPIIVHVGSIDEAILLVELWTPSAQLLAERFWPGPLTMVLPRSGLVPDIVVAGGPTVAIRCPTHPVALALIRAAGTPIAAPSANRSGELSPTCAEHVLRGLDGQIDAVLDGGPTTAGIESTVIDLSHVPPKLLRPGPIPPGEIESIIGPLVRQSPVADEAPLSSPGMLERHYAPRTPMECNEDYKRLLERAITLRRDKAEIAMLVLVDAYWKPDWVIRMPGDPQEYAALMYRMLHDLDQMNLHRILVQMPPDTDEWLAVRDRLRRASASGLPRLER